MKYFLQHFVPVIENIVFVLLGLYFYFVPQRMMYLESELQCIA